MGSPQRGMMKVIFVKITVICLLAMLFCLAMSATAALAVRTADVIATLRASYRPRDVPGRAPSVVRTLTFADRVIYQRAIEEVYWRHRIWPQENPGSKPALDEVMPQAEIERKVEDELRKSQALAD